MNTNLKRLLSLILVFSMLLGMMPLGAISAFAEELSSTGSSTESTNKTPTKTEPKPDASSPEDLDKPLTSNGGIVAYTDGNGLWGECGAKANNSFVLKVYSGTTYLGMASLNDYENIIDGDVYVTWSLPLNPTNTDSYWTWTWAKKPSLSLMPTHVALFADGAKVSEGAVQLNGPDNLNTIVAATVDEDGTILGFATTLASAINAVEDGGTVALVTDVEQQYGVVITDRKLTIDLNGKTFTVTKGDDSTVYRNFLINGASEVTIKNGTVVSKGTTTGTTSSGVWGSVRTEGTAKVTMTGLKLYNYRGNGLNVKALTGTTVTISDTEIYSQYGGGVEAAGGTIELNNIKVEQTGLWTAPYNSMAISVNGGGKITVNSGTYTTEPLAATDAYNQGTSHGSWVAGVLNSGGTLIINGGTFTNGNYGDDSLATAARGLLFADTAGKIEVNGGIFNALKNIFDVQNNLGDATKQPSITVSGGVFSSDPRISASYGNDLIQIADGYELKENADGTYGVKAENEAWILRNGQPKFYDTFAEAIADAQAGETVLLSANVIVDSRITIDKNITIADYGTLTVKFVGNAGISIIKDAVVTLDNLKLDVSNVVANGDCIIGVGNYSNNATLNLNNVTLTGDGYSSAYAVLYVYNSSTLNITNSNITLSNDKASAGGFIKGHSAANGKINITDTNISLTDAKIGFLDGTVKLDGVELNIKGGANAINQSALTVIDSTITIDGADGRALTLSQGNVSIINSALNFSNCSEGEIRFKTGVTLSVDDKSTIAACDIYADSAAVGVAKVNDKFVTGSKTAPSVIVNGEVTNAPVAKVGDKVYESLQAAIDAANGATITVVGSNVIAEDVNVPAGATVTIDLGGNTFYGTILAPNATLTITDGSIVNNASAGRSAIEINAGTLVLTGVDVSSVRHALRIDGAVNATINSGKFSLIPKAGRTHHAVNVSGAATVTINGGEFVGPKGTASDSGSALNVQTGATVTVKGGSFSGGKLKTLAVGGSLSITGGTFDQDPSAYVATGYVAALNGGVYYVVKNVVKTTIYVNSAWAGKSFGTEVDGKIIGINAFANFADALNAVTDDAIIVLADGMSGDESKTEIDFTKAISFTITGEAPNYALPVVTFQNATVTIENAEILIPELDARQNATINVVDSIVHDAGGNSIAKSYYNGAINISGDSVVHMMQVTTMGYITISGNATLNATWQTNVYGNGMIVVKDKATFNTAALHLTGKDYSGRDNTDADRVGKPATIVVDGATFVVGKVKSDNGADYSYNSSKGINIGTIAGKKAVLDIKNGATVSIFMANGETANIGADGTVNVNASSFNVACRGEGDVKLANNKGTMNVSGLSVIDAPGMTNDGDVNFLDGAIIKDSTFGCSVFVAGNVIFRGDNTFAMIYDFGTLTDYYGTTANMAWTIEKGASVTLTDKARYGLGYGDKVVIYGDIQDALNARATLSEDDIVLFMHGLVAQESKGWNQNSSFEVNDAYVVIGSNNSFGNKPGNYGGTYTFTFNNSVLDASRITFYEALSKTVFTFNKCDVKTGTFMTNDADSKFYLVDSVVLSTTTTNGTDEGNYLAGQLTLTNSKLTYSAPLVMKNGILTIVGAGSMLSAPSISGTGKIVIDATGMKAGDIVPIITDDLSEFTGTIEVINNDELYAAVENNQIVLVQYVAMIGNQGYKTLQAAINAAKNKDVITLLAGCAENVTVVQAEGVKFTIDGNGTTYSGTITVDGKSAAYATAGLTIKNVKFDATGVADACIMLGVKGNNNTRYISNLTVESCTFTDNDKTAVGIKSYTGGDKNLTITGCTATGMHSLVQLKNVEGVKVSDTTVTGGKNGISLGASSEVVIDDVTITADGYGIRADANDAGAGATITDCTITAFIPVVVRNVNTNSTITFNGENTFTPGNEYGYDVVIGKTEYEAGKPLPNDAQATVTIGGTDTDVKVWQPEGHGTAGDPYKIYTAEELFFFASKVNDGTYKNVYAILMNDIDLEQKDWTSIGTATNPFTGVFDGQGHKISNLKVTPSNGNAGLFGQVGTQIEGTNATVKNLTVENATIIASGQNCAGVIAIAPTGALVENVKLTGSITIQGYRGVGGIVGNGFPRINNCTVEAEGTIHATYWGVGGILGFASDRGAKVTNATVTGVGNGLTISGYLGGVGGVTGTPHGAATNGATITNVVLSSSNNYCMSYVDASGTVSGTVVVENTVVKVNGEEIIGNDAVATSDGKVYFYLKDAINAAQSGSTIVVVKNVILTDTLVIPAGKTVTLDLNGKTISQSKACTASYSMIENKGNLTITGNGKISFTDTGAGDSTFGWGSYTIVNRGTLVVENGTIEHLGAQAFATHMICAIQQSAGTVTINGGTISTPNYRSVRVNKGDLVINGGVFDGQIWLQPNQGDVTLKVTDGTFEPNGRDASSIFMGNAGEKYTVSSAAISGGTFKGKIGVSDATKLSGSITGGMFSETAKNGTNVALLADTVMFPATADANGYYTIIGCTKVATSDALKAALENGDKDIVIIGNITVDEAITVPAGVTLHINDGCTLRVLDTLTNNGTISGDGKVVTSVMVYVVETVNPYDDVYYNKTATKNGAIKGNAPECDDVACEISLDGGNTWFADTTNGKAQAVTVKTDGTIAISESFQSAFTSAKTGDIVHMLTDAHVQSTNPKKNNGPLRSYYGLILEGNGHTIFTDLESSGASNEYATIKFTSYLAGTGPEVNPVLKNVTIDSQKNAKADLDFVSGEVTFTVTMYNVNLLGNCQYASFAFTSPSFVINKSNTEIYDCTIPSWDAGSAKAIDLYSGEYSLSLNGKCTVYGGTYTKNVTNYLAATSTIEKDASGKYVVTGPYAVQVGDTKYKTLEEAVKYANADDTIKLLKDITLSATVTLPAGITLDGNGKTINGTIKAGGDLTFAGKTTVSGFNPGWYNNTITIGEGASLKVTGGRITVSYGNTFNIIGSITDAKTADKSTITPSLEITQGISFNGNGGGVTFNVTNAYVVIGDSTTKNNGATGEFHMNFTNSIVDFTKTLKTYMPTASGLAPKFNMTATDSVVTFASHLELWLDNTNLTLDNSNLTVVGSFANAGIVNVTNGANFVVKAPIMSSHGGNTGTINVLGGTFELKDSNEDWQNAGTIKVVVGGQLITNDFKCVGDGKIVVDAAALDFGETVTVVDGNGVYNFEAVTEILNKGQAVVSFENGDIALSKGKAVAKIGDEKFVSVADALAYAKAQNMTDVVITLIGENTKAEALVLDDSFYLYTEKVFDKVTFKQEDASKVYYIAGIYTGSRTNGGQFVFDGVNIVVIDQYIFEGNVVLTNNSIIKSVADANCFIYNGMTTIEPGSVLQGVIEDFRGGDMIIDGGKTDGSYNTDPNFQDAIIIINWSGDKLVLKNGAYAKINSANEIGRLTINAGAAVEMYASKLETVEYINVNGTLQLDMKSSVETKKIIGNGKIVIDATGMTAGVVKMIEADLSGFTGKVEVINNPALYATIVNGKIVLVNCVAKIGNTYYQTLADALKAANNNDVIELLWAEGDAPIAMNGSVYGKTVTITGTATVDWSKGFLFIGRGGEGNGKVIFDNANLTSASNSSSYGIHVSGREKNTNNKYDGTLEIKNSTIVLDYLINRGNIEVDNSSLTVKNGFGIAGRPASETESGVAATATITIKNGSYVKVLNHNGMGIGQASPVKEGYGILNLIDSTFESANFNVDSELGDFNVSGVSTVKIATLTGKRIDVEAGATLKDSTIGGGINMLGDLTIDGGLTLTDGLWASNGGTLSGDTLTAKYFMFQKSAYTINADIEAVYGYLSFGGTFEVNSKIHTTGTNGEVLYINGNVTLNNGAVLDSDNSVFVNNNNAVLTIKPGAKVDSNVNITAAGAKLNLDATGMTAGDYYTAITGTVTNTANGSINVINNNKLYAEVVNGKIVLVQYVAMIGNQGYKTLAEAIKAVQEGQTIELLSKTISEGTIKLPATLKNVTFKSAVGTVLKNMTIMASDGNSICYEGLTFDGITFENSRISITGWRNGEVSVKDFTVTNCVFKNLNDTTNSAPVHFNMAATEPVNGFTFTNNVIDGATGGSKSGVYAQVTGEVIFSGNTINNVSFRPYVIQVTTDDGIDDTFTVTGNTFSGSAAGRAQGLGNNAAGTDTVELVVSGNIFKGITSAQQICYWNFNPETTTADLSKNYYDIDILNNPTKIYYNSAAQNGEDLIDMGIFPIYKDEAMTELVEAPAIMVTYADGTIEYFYDMRAAVPHTSNYPKLEGATITLLKDMSGLGMRLMENDMVFDLNGHTYTLTGGTGSQGTETSGFQIRPEVTGTATIKNGTIKVAEGVAIVWMFNNYATNFVVEDVTVDCANMDYSYGESVYVFVSRSGDNAQFLGNTKIINFNSNVAGNAINVGGTMTIADTVDMTGLTVELDANAVLTAREGLTVVTADGYEVVYKNGAYGTYQIVATINGVPYATLAAAFAAAKDGDEVVILVAGTYALTTSGKNITVTGAVKGVEFNCGQNNIGMNGASVTFNNVTFNWAANGWPYHGLAHCGNMVYNDCTFNGTVFLYGNSEIFKNCKFNVTGDTYNVWTYGANKATFEGCTFNSDGKALLIYHEGASQFNEVTITDCDFIASAPVDGKAAIEMDSSYTAGIKLTITNSTATGFGTGNVSGNSLWNNKKGNNTDANNDITVVVDNETVLAPVTFVAYIGDIGYTTIDAAIKAAKAGETVSIAKSGIYEQNLVINKAITVEAAPGASVSIYGQVSIKADGVTLQYVQIYNGSGKALQINAKNVLINACDISGANGLYQSYTSGTVTFKDSYIGGGTYGIHFDGSAGGEIVIDNCVITGWTSFAKTINKVTISKTTFAEGNYNQLRFYQDVELTNVKFNPKMTVDFGVNGVEASFTGCSVTDGSSLAGVIYLGDLVDMGVKVNIDNKRVVALMGGEVYFSLAEALEAAKTQKDIVVDLVTDATLDITAWDALAIGGDTTETITINGNGHTLTFNKLNSDWNHVATNNDAKLILNNMTITDSGKNNGPWNRYDLNFGCDVELNDVTATKAMAFKADATLNGVTVTESGDVYAIWVQANGQKIVIDGLTVTSGRGIKIDEQYVDNAAEVELSIQNASFTTAKKAAILVKSKAGATIVAGNNVDISNVAADKVNLVWVDEDAAAYFGEVTVTGGTLAQENASAFVVAIMLNGNVASYYKTLAAAVADAKTGDVIVLLADTTANESAIAKTNITIDLNGKTLNGNGVYPVLRVQNGASVTVKNGEIVNSDYIFVLGASDGSSAGYLTIESGKYHGETTVASVTKGTLTILGGEFRADAYENGQNFNYMFNCVDANFRNGTAKIEIMGGTFYNFNPADNAAEGAHTNFVANGYHSHSNGNGSFTVAKHSYTTVVTVPTCTEKGYTTYTCSCGASYTADEVNALGHTEGILVAGFAPTCTTNGQTDLKYCTVCLAVTSFPTSIPAKGHTEGKLDAVAPTCTATGLTEGKYCTVCMTIIVPQTVVNAKGHTEVADKAVDATCTSTGLTAGSHCSVCGEVLVKQNTVAALGHKYGFLKVYSASCTEAGYFTIGCKTCGEYFDSRYDLEETEEYLDGLGSFITIDTAPKGHTEVVDAAVDATCSSTGLTEGKHCEVCGEILVKQDVVPTTKHRFGNLVVTSATCLEDGYITIHCGDCGVTFDSRFNQEARDYIKNNYINVTAKGHTEVVDKAVDATCSATGLTEGKHCSVCGEVFTAQDVVPMIPHTEVTIPAKEATFETPGYTEGKKCSVCGVVTVAPQIIAIKAAEAKIGNVSYATLAEAILAAKNGDVIVVLSDIVATGLSVGYNVAQKITIDLGGNTLKSKDLALTAMRNGTELTLRNGTISGNSTGGTLKATWGAKVILGNGLTVLGDVQADAIRIENGTLEVLENALVSVEGGIDCIHSTESTANAVTIAGGTFKGLLNFGVGTVCTITGGIFSDAKVAEYVADGYYVVNTSDGMYLVTTDAPDVELERENSAGETEFYYYASIQDAINAAQAGDIVRLLGDITEKNVSIINDVIFDLNGHTLTATYFAAFYDSDVIDSSANKTGRLVVAHNRVTLPEDNAQMPICIAKDANTGVCTYIFAEVNLKGRLNKITEDGLTVQLRPMIMADKAEMSAGSYGSLDQYLSSAYIANAHVSLSVRLNWIDEKGNHDTQEFELDAKEIGRMYDGTGIRSLVLTGMTGLTNVSISLVLTSETGVEMENVLGTFNPITVNP